MPRFDHPAFEPPAQQTDTSFVLGWTVDIYAMQAGVQRVIYRDCSLASLICASALFERLALNECAKPRAYGEETKIKYVLPKGIAGAAFIRILEWIYAIKEISAHGDIEDPQITTFDGDSLQQFLRLFQAAKLMELKYPFANQKRLPDIIKAQIKKGFDTRLNAFKNITIEDRDIGLIWDVGGKDRNESITKLMLALYVDTMDVRKEFPHKFKDNVLERFEKLMAMNTEFRSAVIDVRTKKNKRLNEEDRERKGLPRATPARGAKSKMAGGKLRNGHKENVKRSGSGLGYAERELTDTEVMALMSRPEEFPLSYHQDYSEEYDGMEG